MPPERERERDRFTPCLTTYVILKVWASFWYLARRVPKRDFQDVMSFSLQYIGFLGSKILCWWNYIPFTQKYDMQWLYGSQIRWIKLHRAQHVFTYIFYEHILLCCGPLPSLKLAASNWKLKMMVSFWNSFLADSHCWNSACHFIFISSVP